MIYEIYKRFADFLSALLGDNTEIVLHDFSNLEHSIVYLVNGHITEREIGDSVTDLMLEFLNKNKGNSKEFLCNYISKSANGKQLYSSTFFIYGEEKELIGALCTNTDYCDYDKAIDLMKKFMPNFRVEESVQDISETKVIETLHNDHETLTISNIHDEIEKLSISPKRMTPEEKMEVVTSLYHMGTFMLKGAVLEAAQKLETSEATIYRYIRNAKQSVK